MTRKGPLFTLLAGGGLAVALLIASVIATNSDDEEADLAAGDGTPTEAPATPEATGEPEPTASPAAEEVEPVPYVGYVDGGGASVAVIVNGDEATGYVCDGSTVEAWLEGTATNGELVLDDGAGAELVGSFDDASAEGEIAVDALDWTFEIEMVQAPEGLYRIADTVVSGAEVEGGWIVLPDGTQVGVATVDGSAGPAPELDPDTGEVELNGETVTADRVG